MVEPRAAISTVTFIDNYCAVYRDLFSDVRSFEAFKYLHLGMISDLARKSLPAIARAVGLSSDQVLHPGQTHDENDIGWRGRVLLDPQ
jgi:SRSO17 transposase